MLDEGHKWKISQDEFAFPTEGYATWKCRKCLSFISIPKSEKPLDQWNLVMDCDELTVRSLLEE